MVLDGPADFTKFSLAYTCMILFVIMVFVLNKFSIEIFIRMGIFGVGLIVVSIIFIASVGVYSFTNTDFRVGEETNVEMGIVGV